MEGVTLSNHPEPPLYSIGGVTSDRFLTAKGLYWARRNNPDRNASKATPDACYSLDPRVGSGKVHLWNGEYVNNFTSKG